MNNEEKDRQSELTIKIVDTRIKNFIRPVSVFMCFTGIPIALGVFLDNTVMQWIGFVGFLALCFAEMLGSSNKAMEKLLTEAGRLKRFTAIDDAMKYLQSLEKPNQQ